MDIDTYILIGEAVFYIISCVINLVIFYKMNKTTISKIEELSKKLTEPISQPSQPVIQPVMNQPEEETINTSRVNRDTCVQMNAYYDASRGVYEISPKNI